MELLLYFNWNCYYILKVISIKTGRLCAIRYGPLEGQVSRFGNNKGFTSIKIDKRNLNANSASMLYARLEARREKSGGAKIKILHTSILPTVQSHQFFKMEM